MGQNDYSPETSFATNFKSNITLFTGCPSPKSRAHLKSITYEKVVSHVASPRFGEGHHFKTGHREARPCHYPALSSCSETPQNPGKHKSKSSANPMRS
jgi:hypothetical protein